MKEGKNNSNRILKRTGKIFGRSLMIGLCMLLAGNVTAQSDNYKWWNPARNTFPTVEGQGWTKEVKSFYDRLPARAEANVRKDVWNLSRHSAGLYIKFKSNTGEIKVRYATTKKDNYAMPHMPATGVSGVDLYAFDHSGKWIWVPGRYHFADTVTYQFTNIEIDQQYKGRDCEFRLFLPLYNGVEWMEVGVPEGKSFSPLPLSEEKPVVVYGTSIAQGGCASRPGMAWTSLLERQLDYPLINLAFSGNGRLEKPLIDLIAEIDAKIYVLDCIPNLTNISAPELETKIRDAVKGLQAKRSGIPILLVEHSQGPGTSTGNFKMVEDCERASEVTRNTFAKLQEEGVRGIYLLSQKDIGMDINATVDGIHPADIGMKQHADAYEKIIREIIHEPSGSSNSALQPVIQDRDGYDWRGRHQEILRLNKVSPPQNVIIANSIIHYWAGQPKASIVRGEDSWNRYLKPLGLRNLGFGWDRIENALWRVYHGELDGYTAKHVVIMIGTNNVGSNSDEEIIEGLHSLILAVKLRQPKTSILLSGIFPRRNTESRIEMLNRKISQLAAIENIKYINPGIVLLNTSGKIDESLFSDGVHPNATGYNKIAPLLATYLKN